MQSIESNHADMPNNEMFDKSTEYSNFAKESNNLPHLDATNECNRGSEKPDCSLDKLTDILLTDARINADDKIVKYCAETSHRDKEPASPNRRKKKKTKRGKPWNTKVISFDKKNKQTRNFIDKILTSDKSHCQEGNVYYDMWKTDHPTQFTSDLLLMISNNDTNIQCQKLEETNYQLLKFKKNIKSSFFPDETNDSEENITNSTKKNCIVNENGTIDQLNSSQDTTMIEITTEDSKVITRLNLIEKTDDKIDIQSIVMHCEDEGSQCEVSGQVCEELIKPEQLEYDHLERDAVNDMLKNLKDDIIDESKQSVEKVDKNKNITFNDNMHLDSTDKLRDDIDRVSDESIETKILHQVGLTENMNSKKEDIKPVVQPVSIEKSEKDTSVNTVDEGLSMMDLPMMGVNSPDKTNSLIENESSLDIAKKDAEPEYVKIKPSNSLSNETLDIDMVIDGQLKYNAKTTDTRQYGEVDNFAKPSVTIQNKKETNGTFASPFFLGKLNEAPKNLFTDEEIAGFQRFKEESNRFLLNTPLHSYSEETKLNGWKQKNISSKKEQGASKELFKSERSKKLPSNDSQEEYVIRTLNELKSVFDDSTTPSCRNKIMMYQNSGITNHFEHELGNFLSFSPQKKINMAGKKVSNIYFNDHSVDIQRENDTIYSYASNIQLPSLSKEINHPSSGKTINQVDTSLHALPNIQQDYGIGNYGNVFNDTLSDDSSLSPSPRSPTGKEVRSILMKHRKTSPKKVKFNNKVFIGTAYQAGEYSSTNIVPVYAKNNNQIIKLESIYIDQIPSTSLNSKLNRFAKRDVDVSTTMKIKASSENMNKSGVSKISNFVEKNNSDFIKITNLDG